MSPQPSTAPPTEPKRTDPPGVATAYLSVRKKLLFGLTCGIAPLVAAELICRLAGLGALRGVEESISVWHRSPDGKSFWVLQGREYNADGVRDRPRPIEKPPGVYRIACLGDSVTMGYGLDPAESYPHWLEVYLRQASAPAEVFNIALAGWSTEQELAAYQKIARKYRPDHVFLGVCLNDIPEMHNNLAAPPPRAIGLLMRHSAFVRWLADAEARQVHTVEELFGQPASPAVESGWQALFATLLELDKQTRGDGCPLSVVVFPFRFQLADDAPEPTVQRRLCRFCQEHGIPCMDLLPVLGELGETAFVDESHFSLAGAQAVARELIRWQRSGCRQCGFEFSGVDAPACPRCGTPFER